MRFSNGSNIDKQGRICLGKFVKPAMQVVVYATEESNELIYIAPFNETTSDPDLTGRKVDSKSRISLPVWLRGRATRVWIGRVEGSDELVLKLIRD